MEPIRAVVRRCPGARLDPVFETRRDESAERHEGGDLPAGYGARRRCGRTFAQAYRNNPVVLGIFPVAAYNGGPRNVTKLYRVLTRMKVAAR